MTYPVRFPDERDHHFGMNNFVAAVAADSVWFNSNYHLETFHLAMREWLRKMPEDRCLVDLAEVQEKSAVQSPGVEIGSAREERLSGPIRIAWAARWEHDKAPDVFFDAMEQLKTRGHDFRLSVLGESFKDVPPVFAESRVALSEHIDNWGYAADRTAYFAALREADLFVSTAKHEFFGLSACEAMGHGAVPVLPERLAYPELLRLDEEPEHAVYFYDSEPDGLVNRLDWWINQLEGGVDLREYGDRAQRYISRFNWADRVSEMDTELLQLV